MGTNGTQSKANQTTLPTTQATEPSIQAVSKQNYAFNTYIFMIPINSECVTLLLIGGFSQIFWGHLWFFKLAPKSYLQLRNCSNVMLKINETPWMGIKTPSLANVRQFETPVPTASTWPTPSTNCDYQIDPSNCDPYWAHIATSTLSGSASSGLCSVTNSAAISPTPSSPWPLCIWKY